MRALDRLKAMLPVDLGSRYRALCSAQKRIAAVYLPSSLTRLDATELRALESLDGRLEHAYFSADNESFDRVLRAWEERRKRVFSI